MGNEFQKEAFVGKKYEKIMNQKFSVPTLIFGSWYWAYRKMILEAFGLLIVKSLANFILSSIAFSIIGKAVGNDPSADTMIAALISAIVVFLIITVTIGIFTGFLFRPVYEKFVNRKVRKIVDKDVSDSESEEIETCRKKGGTSILFLILFIIISSSITGAINARNNSNDETASDNDYSYIIDEEDEDETSEDDATKDDEELDENEEDNDSKKSSSKTKEISYEEYKYKIFTDIDISDYIEVDAPTAFKANTENDYIIEYTHSQNREKDIEFTIAMVDTESAEDFIEDLTKTNGLSTTDDMYSADVDDITWYIVGFMLDDNIIYYNAFEKNDKVFLYRYESSANLEDESLNGSYEDVIFSIKYINKEKTEVEKNGNTIDEDEEEEETNTTSRSSNNTNTSNENTTTNNASNTNTSSDEDEDEDTNTTNTNTNTSRSNDNTNTNSSNTSITITPTNVTYNNAN